MLKQCRLRLLVVTAMIVCFVASAGAPAFSDAAELEKALATAKDNDAKYALLKAYADQITTIVEKKAIGNEDRKLLRSLLDSKVAERVYEIVSDLLEANESKEWIPKGEPEELRAQRRADREEILDSLCGYLIVAQLNGVKKMLDGKLIKDLRSSTPAAVRLAEEKFRKWQLKEKQERGERTNRAR